MPITDVEVFGERITIKHDRDEEYIHTLAAFVDERIRQVAQSLKVGVPLRAAIMAALSIADEYHQKL